MRTNATITIVTKPPEDYNGKDRERVIDCIELFKEHGMTIKTKEKIHQKFAIIDRKVIWYGSINLLSYGMSQESIMRIESLNIAEELLETLYV